MDGNLTQPELGIFDTVTAIHLLEHLPAGLIFQALSNLLKVTRHRLLISIPYEAQLEVAYGHQQTFHREQLKIWGRWCIEQWQGVGRMWVEDCEGGLLVVERNTVLEEERS